MIQSINGDIKNLHIKTDEIIEKLEQEIEKINSVEKSVAYSLKTFKEETEAIQTKLTSTLEEITRIKNILSNHKIAVEYILNDSTK